MAYGSLYFWARHLTHCLLNWLCLSVCGCCLELIRFRIQDPDNFQPAPARVHISHNVAIYRVVASMSLFTEARSTVCFKESQYRYIPYEKQPDS